MNPIISVENVSKRYLLGHRADRPGQIHLRELVSREARNAARKALDMLQGRQIVQGDEIEEFWALKHVTFDVHEGEVLGIVGRNGAGKSTLLKILSHITEPTEGRITIRGRVSSLLEVGTGFHPELSGRENIYLNGAILGMSRAEIRKKFDEIVAFADVERFLDTPVKRYSSGMYVRLAFAVAANLEPEILIIDEVLAVGDIEFQKKCLGKMDEVSRRDGRTVIFVSHNMAAVDRLCSRAVLLSQGQIALQGSTESVLGTFVSSSTHPAFGWQDVEALPRKYTGSGKAIISKIRLRSAGYIPFRGELVFDVVVALRERLDRIRISFTILEMAGAPVGSGFSNEIHVHRGNASMTLTTTISELALAPGQYQLGVSIGRGDHKTGPVEYDVVSDCVYFSVAPAEGQDNTLSTWSRGWGAVVFDHVVMDALSETNVA